MCNNTNYITYTRQPMQFSLEIYLIIIDTTEYNNLEKYNMIECCIEINKNTTKIFRRLERGLINYGFIKTKRLKIMWNKMKGLTKLLYWLLL